MRKFFIQASAIQNDQKAFTMVELIISISVSGILAGIMFIATFGYFSVASQSLAATEMALEAQTILTQLVEDIRVAAAITTTNTLVDANKPGGWVTSDPSNVIIIQSPALNSIRDIIYDSATGSPFKNDLVYFSTGTSIFKRVLKNTSAVGNIAVTSCPTAIIGCPKDVKLSDRLSNLTFTFYDSNDATTAIPENARSVLFTVNLTENIYGKAVNISNSTRITLRNN
jgi:prepilin-type N-terminal cleavage/methylation domain-containing protein